jgi:flagellar biogenesis protein FliO
MFDLFGAEMPLAVRFFLAFLIVLGLIGVAAWAVRRFGSARLSSAVRGRQPRLAVIDYASVDARRRLILVRRDNVEHLVMIGGPTDVVVESNIVRAVPATRDLPAARQPSAAEMLPRALPLPEAGNGNGNSAWPLQPEPAAPFSPPRRARVEPMMEEPPAMTPAHSEQPKPPRDTLTAIADDLSMQPLTPSPAPAVPFPPRVRQPGPRPAEPRAPTPSAPHAANAETGNAADQSLAEMAQRLEAALRKPKVADKAADKPAEPRETVAAAAPVVETSEAEASLPAPPAPTPQPRPARAVETKPARSDTKSKEGKLYDTLEQEMASLLGRPPGKTG